MTEFHIGTHNMVCELSTTFMEWIMTFVARAVEGRKGCEDFVWHHDRGLSAAIGAWVVTDFNADDLRVVRDCIVRIDLEREAIDLWNPADRKDLAKTIERLRDGLDLGIRELEARSQAR